MPSLAIRLCLMACFVALSAGATWLTPKDFNFTRISNRIVTPNGDGKNDRAIFEFDNPQFAEVTGRIYDLKGAFVAVMLPGLNPNNQLSWDGKSSGSAVPTGVYIYVISADGFLYRGAVMVVK